MISSSKFTQSVNKSENNDIIFFVGQDKDTNNLVLEFQKRSDNPLYNLGGI